VAAELKMLIYMGLLLLIHLIRQDKGITRVSLYKMYHSTGKSSPFPYVSTKQKAHARSCKGTRMGLSVFCKMEMKQI
jgi:hypothetical protein